MIVQRLPAYVHLEVLNDEPSSLSAKVEPVLTSRDLREWLLDSGASKHMTPSTDRMTNIQPHKGKVFIGDNSTIPIHSEGSLELLLDGKGGYLSSRVFYVPQLGFHLMSVSEVCKLGMRVIFDEYTVSIQDKATGKEVRGGSVENGVYKLHAVSSISNSPVGDLWHYRFGHLNFDALRQAFRDQLVTGLPDVGARLRQCISCLRGKQHREAIPLAYSRRATELLELVHSDLCGPMQTQSLGGALYFMLIIDDCRRFTWVYFLRRKDEAFECFKDWKTYAEKECGKPVKAICADKGGEFTSNAFDNFCKENGIRRELANTGSPWENGVVERKNRTVVEMVRTMLEHRELPQSLWAEATSTSVHILNRSPTAALQKKTPYDVYFGRKPDVSHFRVFGCDAYVHIAKKQRGKFDSKSQKMIFEGYNTVSKGYRLYDPERREIVVSLDVVFDEHVATEGVSGPQPSSMTPDLPILGDHEELFQDLPPVEVPLPDVPVADRDPVAALPSETEEVPMVKVPKWLLDTLRDSGVTEPPLDWTAEGTPSKVT